MGQYSDDVKVVVIDTKTVTELLKVSGSSPQISPNGLLLMTNDSRGLVVRDVKTGRERFVVDPQVFFGRHAFSPDSSLLAVTFLDIFVRIYETEDFTEVNNFPGTFLNFSPDGTIIVTYNKANNQAVFYDVLEGNEILSKEMHETQFTYNYEIMFSSNGEVFVDNNPNGRTEQIAYFYRMSDGEFLYSLEGYVDSFSPNGSLFAISINPILDDSDPEYLDEDFYTAGRVYIYETATGELYYPDPILGSNAYFSSDGNYLIVFYGNTIILYGLW